MNLEEVKQKIDAANVQSERLNKERQINIGKKETYTTQLEKALTDYKKAYGVELTVANLTAELERVKAEKEKELALVEGMIACINNGDYNGARELAGEPIVEESDNAVALEVPTADAIMPAPIVETPTVTENNSAEESKTTKKRGRPKKEKVEETKVEEPVVPTSTVAEVPTPTVAEVPTPIAPTPVAPTPVAPTPVAPTPVAPTPVAPNPVVPTPVASTPVVPTPVAPTPVVSAPVTPTPVVSAPVTPTPVVSAPVTPMPVAPTPVAPAPVAPTPVAPAPVVPTPMPAPINTGEIPTVAMPTPPTPNGILNGALEGFVPANSGPATPPTDFQSILGGSAFNMD